MAIGIFDSGVGGLSMVRAVDSIAPSADLIYLGDTARVPYGLKTTEQLEEITADNFRFMIDAGVEKVFIACGTISSLLCNKGYPDMGIPYVTVIDATAKSAAIATRTGSVTVLGTVATCRNRGFEKELLSINGGLRITYVPCQDFVTLCESGRVSPDDPVVMECVRKNLEPVPGDSDTVILGCTHFPFLEEAIWKVLPNVNLINCSYETAYANRDFFREGSGMRSFWVTGDPSSFSVNSDMLLGYHVETGRHING